MSFIQRTSRYKIVSGTTAAIRNLTQVEDVKTKKLDKIKTHNVLVYNYLYLYKTNGREKIKYTMLKNTKWDKISYGGTLAVC